VESGSAGENGREKGMFTLILCFPAQGKRPRSQVSVSSGHIPQIRSTINTQGMRSGCWRVTDIGQDASDDTLSSTVYVYLADTYEETD